MVEMKERAWNPIGVNLSPVPRCVGFSLRIDNTVRFPYGACGRTELRAGRLEVSVEALAMRERERRRGRRLKPNAAKDSGLRLPSERFSNGISPTTASATSTVALKPQLSEL